MYSFRKYLPFYKRNLRVALPVMLTQFGSALVGMFDSIMVGHYGTADLAAVSFSNAIFFMVMVFAMGALMGITPLIGIEIGKHDEEGPRRIASYFQNGIYFTALLSVVMVVLLSSVLPFLDKLGQDPEVIEAARPYYIYIVLSIVPFLFFFLQKQFLEGLGNTFVAMIITIACNLLNILFNWIFIFGHCGAPAMGAAGAGLATLISRLTMPFCFLAVIYLKRDWRRYLQMFSRTMASWKTIWRLLKIGAPIGVQSLSETFVFASSYVLIGWLSKEALAAHQVSNQIANLTFMLAQGIGAATTIRVSHQLGTGNLYAVRMASRASIHLCLLMNTIGATLMVSLCSYIPYIFTEDPVVIEMAKPLILIAGLFQYADGMQCVGAAMLRGITDVKIPMVISFVSYVLITLPIGALLMFVCDMGAIGMWIGFIIGLFIAAILFHWRFRNQYKRLVANQPVGEVATTEN